MNGEDRRRKVAFLVLALAAVMAVASAAFAVSMGLTSSEVGQLGGTPIVDVNCPATPCQVSKVTWTISGTPLKVTAVNVQWTPTSSGTGVSYNVYVNLYNSGNSPVGSGSATQSVPTSGSVTTTVTLGSPVDPAVIYKVEIVIAQN